MVKIRLARHGRHKRPFYRIVVADSRSPRDGRFIEVLGTYDPLAQASGVQLDAARTKGWLDQGAQVTDTVRHLLKRAGLGARAV
jgi:small subunit ribosomal protein S16